MIKFLKELINKLRGLLGKYDVTFPYVIAIILALIVVIGGINIFVELTDTLSTEQLSNYDDKITDYIISFRSPILTDYFTIVTQLGGLYGYIVVVFISAFISLVVFRKWKYMVQITFVLALSALSNLVLKRFINRARPEIEHLVTVETLSYPSGHAMAAMAFYGFLIYLFYKFKMHKLIKYSVIFLLTILIFSIGISRIYLGVHFPSDVAGGFIAGAIWVIFCVILFNIIEVFRRDPKTPGGVEKMDAIED
ncbi:phosphatase PAP2 family protein [Wocania ichthyoenteri]|uniref:phosphatase PAP2 family protein n=1 Tax=Wocania ichthyoenteri TaxID=1230531 RepID=UPI00068F0050|nr:phosphatase PAP2 family protein [Wocania ichthyoenteri]